MNALLLSYGIVAPVLPSPCPNLGLILATNGVYLGIGIVEFGKEFCYWAELSTFIGFSLAGFSSGLRVFEFG